MKKTILFTDDKKIFETINQIIKGKNELTWCTYNLLEKNMYLYADTVIMHFDKKMSKYNEFKVIIKVKERLGHSIPILAIVEEVTKQGIFCILKMGVYDYIERTYDIQKYEKKLDELFLWSWYLSKYEPKIKQ